MLKFEHRKGIVAHFEQVTSLLTPSASSNQFEESLKQLGELLGFTAQRPDNDFGVGPDVLWLLNDSSALIIEVKSRKKLDNPLNKDEHGQLLNSAQWFQTIYPGFAGCRVVVHPNNLTTDSVVPDDSYALTLDKLGTLVGNTRELLTNLSSVPMGRETTLAKCDEDLLALNLTPDRLVKVFLEAFEIKESH